jgi:hypothetical protein
MLVRGVESQVKALAVFDNGTGSALYAAGDFNRAGEVSCNSIAKWDGANWSALGAGLPASQFNSLAVFDDGTGPTLYAGGTGGNHGFVLRWNGSTWLQIGATENGGAPVNGLIGFDDGSGPALYVCGLFNSMDGIPALKVARWRAGNWESLGLAANEGVASFALFDDGSGARLYGAGGFLDGAMVLHSLGIWDGAHWTGVGPLLMHCALFALSAFDADGGPALYGY